MVKPLLTKSFGVVAANAALFMTVMFAAFSAASGPFVAVVVPPWSKPDNVVSVIASADGSLVAQGAVAWIAIAHSPNRDFASRLRAAGALFLFNPAAIPGCFSRK